MSKINTEIIKNRSVSLIADLKKLSSEFVAYNKKAVEIEGRTELTREYKDSQLADEVGVVACRGSASRRSACCCPS